MRFRIELNCGALWMSPALLVLSDTDASVFRGITTHFVFLNISDLFLLSFWSQVMVSASESLYKTTNRSDRGLYSEIIAIGQNQMGTIRRSMRNIYLALCWWTMSRLVTVQHCCPRYQRVNAPVYRADKQRAYLFPWHWQGCSRQALGTCSGWSTVVVPFDGNEGLVKQMWSRESIEKADSGS